MKTQKTKLESLKGAKFHNKLQLKKIRGAWGETTTTDVTYVGWPKYDKVDIPDAIV